jgi:hypothetical protein
MSRFFAFGCSYTRYAYATWADYIGVNFDEYYNYGCGGHPTQKMHFDFIKEKMSEFITDKSIDVLNTVESIFINDSQFKQSTRFSNEFQNKILSIT